VSVTGAVSAALHVPVLLEHVIPPPLTAPDEASTRTFRLYGVAEVVTVTLKERVLVFPWPSVAEHETVVAPTGNVDPDAG
jgi:hypothetical protein